MRDVKRIKKIVGWIEKEWSKTPDWRFYQFLINKGLIEDNGELFHLEDSQVLKFLESKKENEIK